jgi:dTDP-4-amino-4,6-dideoxygalactose transaminase
MSASGAEPNTMTKRIHSSRDLAINGAAPAFAEPIHVGRPNIGDRAKFLDLVNQMLDRNWLTNNGPLVQDLESRIARFLGVRHCVAMCNGTVALEIAIRALDLSGEVIVPSYTFIATAHALHWQGITPVFADIDPGTHNLDPAAVLRALSPRTTGIIGVHLWGRAAPIEALQAIATERGLKLLFDAAHAFGCTHDGRMLGNFGACEVLSFHATKFFNTFEGGAVVTNDDELAAKMRLMRNFGFAGYDNVVHPGTNGKLTEICAAMGIVNLAGIDAVIDTNRRQHHAYRAALAGVPGVSLIAFDESGRNNYQYAVIEVGESCPVSRDDLVRALHAENVLVRKYFWPGCHGMEPYRSIYPRAGELLPSTSLVADRVIVLPTGASLRAEQIEIIGSIFRALATTGGGLS